MNTFQIENQIRELLVTESNCGVLSDKLFGPNGLFSQLGPTSDDRIRIGRSPLFKDAQKRIRLMERQQAELLRTEIKKMGVTIGRNQGK